MSPPTTVVFDLGGVLIDWSPRRLYRELIDDPVELEHFLAEVASPQWHDLQDRGRPMAEAIAELAAQHPDQAALIEAFNTRWPEMFGGAYPATVDIVRELAAAGIRLLALTNYPAEKFAAARADFEVLSAFEGIVVSGEEGIAKPDREIFDRLLERYDVDPGSTVYIDDRAEHVETARQLGLAGVVYTGAATLRDDLARLGLPVAAGIAVRPGRRTDLPELTELYNHYVRETTHTFDLEPWTVAERAAWFEHYADTGRHRLLVAVEAGQLLGYATSSTFRDKAAYQPSVETTIYLDPRATGRGVGSMLYQQLFADLRDEDVHRAYAGIALPNPASIALHRRFGFTDIGTFEQVGRKHGRWWDVLWLQRAVP
ncbi:MAG TPA: GNAT family N-acetyltransferase [Mycobacteriales bacterium]|nr:GNAT family N-acetyltransferase [Mycobacteriales bacterium]